jgi:hypothetical protein
VVGSGQWWCGQRWWAVVVVGSGQCGLVDPSRGQGVQASVADKTSILKVVVAAAAGGGAVAAERRGGGSDEEGATAVGGGMGARFMYKCH